VQRALVAARVESVHEPEPMPPLTPEPGVEHEVNEVVEPGFGRR
jgi:hypothetical protein